MLIINTGGTFNKRYNPLKGELEVPKDSIALDGILKYFYNLEYNLINIIHKDSLDILDCDREDIAKTIKNSNQDKILIIHGTDTMDKTAEFLNKNIVDKKILLTGAMVPVSIDGIEASTNLSMSIGYLLNAVEDGIYISMHGLVDKYKKVYKNREVGVFQRVTCKG
jgi:L-asparaginase